MTKKKPKAKPLKWFFYDGFLHKKIHIQRATDIITAFRYSDGKMYKLVYSDVRKNGKRAYKTSEVSRFMNRSDQTFRVAINEGGIHEPEMTYGLDENRRPYQHMWSEENIWELHEWLSGRHIGRPRHDGRITNARNLPNKQELRAMLRTGMVLGYQDSEGNFIPTWEAENL